MKKQKCKCPEPGLTAPFYMLTYGDMMTLLLTFFVLLFSMSTLQTIKFQAQMAVMQGSLGISELYQHAPMQKELPAPSVRKSQRIVARSELLPTAKKPLAETAPIDSQYPKRDDEVETKVQAIRTLGINVTAQTLDDIQELTIIVPTYELFGRGEWEIDMESHAAKKAAHLYRTLAEQLVSLHDYQIFFTGHTDALPVRRRPGEIGPKNNTELGFMRAMSLYDAFFADALTDKSRIQFSSQGDFVPIIPNAYLDSERRKNRRVEITLRKVLPEKLL